MQIKSGLEIDRELYKAREQAGSKIETIADELSYTGRITVCLVASIPDSKDYNTTNLIGGRVDLNYSEYTEEEIYQALETGTSKIESSYDIPEFNILYRTDSTYIIHLQISSVFANEQSLMKFCVWAPDQDATSFVKSLADHANDLWEMFVQRSTVQ